jgi:hypothetical protein
MSEVTTIREALAAALNAGLGEGYQVNAYILANPTPPSLSVFPSEVLYHHTFGATNSAYTFTVRALVALSSDIGAQQNLDALMGNNGGGVKASLEADVTLGGVCSSVKVESAGNYQPYVTDGGSQVVGVDWTVEVYA